MQGKMKTVKVTILAKIDLTIWIYASTTFMPYTQQTYGEVSSCYRNSSHIVMDFVYASGLWLISQTVFDLLV